MNKILYNPFRIYNKPLFITQYSYTNLGQTGIYHHNKINEFTKDENLVVIWHIKYKH